MSSQAEAVIRLGANPKHPQRRSSASVRRSASGSRVSQAAESIYMDIAACQTQRQRSHDTYDTDPSRMSNTQQKQIWSSQMI